MADNVIKIKTEIDTKGATSQLSSLENRILKMSEKADKFKTSLSNMESTKVPTEKYANLQKEIEKCDGALEKMATKIKAAEASGASKTKISKMNEEAEALSDKMMDIDQMMKEMEANGTATQTMAEANPEPYQQTQQALTSCQRDMAVLNQRHDELIAKQNAANKNGKKAFTGIGDCIDKVTKRVVRLAARIFIFSQITKAFRAMVSGMQEGFQNLAQYSDKYNNSMSQLKSAQAELKNNMAAAFEPIMNWIIPAIATLCGWLSTAAETLSKFFAALSGSKTYTKATKQAVNYANAVKEADSAQKGALASFDDLNVLDQSSSGSDSSGGEVSGAGAFEEGQISDDFLEKVQKIKDLMQEILPYVLLIGAALLAWKVFDLLTSLMAISPLLGTILGIIALIAGLALAVWNYLKMWQEGVTWQNLAGYLAGVAIAIAACLALGEPVMAMIILLVAGIAGLVLAIKDIIDNGVNANNLGLLVISTLAVIIATFLLFGATAGAIVTIIAAVIAIIAMLVAYGGNGAEALGHLKAAFGALGDFISKIFAGDVEGAFESLKEAGKEFGNFFLSVAEGIANGFIKMVNAIIDAINSIEFGPIPDWVPVIGGQTFSLDIPHWDAVCTLPRLANGGITTGSTLANIGEAGQEAVLPLENNTSWMNDLADRLVESMGNIQGKAELIVDGKTAGQIFYPLIQNEASRIGTSMAAR